MKKSLLNLILAITLIMGMAAVLWAAVPPPSANQYLGYYDTKYSAYTKTECLGCHVSDDVLVPRHHNLIITKNMMCLDCHVLISDGSGGFVFEDFRTCSNCHKTTPHHVSSKAVAQDCQGCHGDFIDNPLDNHYVPTYPVSSVTPMIHGREVTATDGSLATVQGCAACHQPDATAVDPITNTTRAIYSNADTHHGTLIGFTGGIGKCTWCHNFDQPGLAIRQCEACHGVKSLHNVQRPSSTADIVPGSEAAGYGHIGNNWDCAGCHVSWYGNASTSPATAIIPAIKGQSAYTLAAGKEIALTITGVSFVNVGGNGVTYNPSVSISNATTSITLTPASFTDSEIQVLVPALQAGSYDLRVTKEGVKSNLAKLVVIPELAVKTAILSSKNTVTVVGTGFGAAPPADYTSGLGVSVGEVQCKILSWSDTKVVASNAAVQVGAMVTVKALNGSVSKPISAAAAKTR
ncbi:MAG: hypothetical protein CXR30_10015 [Geobacter sp.]|nr:MAG: hypothetical protein CXR30_10015 [Geobacter sp.]